ncbi:MAG: hypothetical protein QM537_08275 [Candidatus Symbiobacter sp.]|nr:hypothetical protein [Candidatus Symbiobacter sp.]
MNGLDYFLWSFIVLSWALVAYVKYGDYVDKRDQKAKNQQS